MRRCFNGHLAQTEGCEGCHHLHHVIEPGRVVSGELVPPRVNGPEGCEQCHLARHYKPDRTCARCSDRYAGSVTSAMAASEPLRQEIQFLHFQHWLLGWKGTALGWGALFGGGFAGGLFGGGDNNLIQFVVLTLFVPVLQWVLRRAIAKKESKLPRLTPTGEVIFGEEPEGRGPAVSSSR